MATGAEVKMRSGGFSHQDQVYTTVAVSSSAWLDASFGEQDDNAKETNAV